ncbi:hypothetical protein CHU98_g12103, partial [Xylaria longipes]
MSRNIPPDHHMELMSSRTNDKGEGIDYEDNFAAAVLLSTTTSCLSSAAQHPLALTIDPTPIAMVRLCQSDRCALINCCIIADPFTVTVDLVGYNPAIAYSCLGVTEVRAKLLNKGLTTRSDSSSDISDWPLHSLNWGLSPV